MKTFRSIRAYLAAALVVTSIYSFVDPTTYLYALQVERAKEARVRDVAAKLGVDPEFLLHPEGSSKVSLRGVMAWANAKLGLTATPAPNDQPLDVREAIARVKSHYALVAADTAVAKLAGVLKLASAPASVKAKKHGAIRGELESAIRLLDKDLLPPLQDDLPSVARARDRDARNAIDSLRRQARAIINNPHALDDANIDATLQQLSTALSGSLTLTQKRTRWTRDPFPLKDAYKTAPTKPAPPTYGSNAISSTSAIVAAQATTSATSRPSDFATKQATSVATDVAALATSLKTPAKAFTWVHDHIGWDHYSGVAKGALGTLKEGSGNDWDQALLLRDVLIAQGYQAQIEWGKVTLPIARLMNLAGTEDPLQAANLFATAGFDGVILTSGGRPTAVQLTHAWVRAFVPFLPNRGATNGPADSWVRLDPSFKRYTYQSGVNVNAAWSEDDYLRNAPVQSPTDYYSDKLWTAIRTSGIDCKSLGQVPKSGTIRAENFPFIPSTLTVGIDQQLGLAADPPSSQMQRVTLTLTSGGQTILSGQALDLASIWGKKVTLTFPPATSDDAAIINSYGGLFNTPAYLVRLKPVLALDDVAVAEGAAVSAGAALDLGLSFDQPNVATDSAHHDVVAGETHTLVFDAGRTPDTLVASRAARLQTLADADAVLSEKLFLIGLRYMEHVDDGLQFAAGVRWHRAVKRAFEADVRRQIDVAYNVGGAPIRLTPAENNIDVARLVVGAVPIGSDVSKRPEVLSLAGIESSYREGAIWEEMESQQGISAAKALLLARRAGQQLYTVDSGNVDTILATASLASDVEDEIRGAIAQGRIAKLAPNPIVLGRWSGTGYILEDPLTGAATYPISGGLAGGSDTGDAVAGIKELLGSESWLSGSPLGELLSQLLSLLGGGGNSSDAPSTTQSDPVNLSSGNMYRSATDLSIVARGIPVALTRTYNSRSAVNGPFGYGWTFNYGEQLIPNGDGSVTYREADGTEHFFANNAGTFVSPSGKHLTLTTMGSGWLLRFKDGMQFTFNANGLLVAQTDLNGNAVTINRDLAGNITNVIDASGRTVLTFTYTGGKITQVTDLGNRSVTYAYTGDDLTSVTDTIGKLWTMTYDLGHNMTGYADPLGNKQSYDYDADDRLMHHVDAVGAEEFFHYDLGARQSVLTDRRGGDRLIAYDELGRATLEADPAGNVVKASFDADNNRTQTIDSRGHATAYEFDLTGNVTKQTSPDGGIVTTTYDANSRPLVSTDAAGATTTNSYDGSGNLLTSSRTIDGVTETTTNTYDSNGQLQSTTDPMNHTSSMTWNSNGTMATRTDAGNNVTTFVTDPLLGRITSIKDPNQNETKLGYDDKDRITSMTDPYNNTTGFAYDDAGRRTSVTTSRGTTVYTYDAEGRVLTVKDPLNNTTKTTYNLAGDVTSRTDARGNVTKYEYDAIGRVMKMTDPAGGVWTYGYCSALGGGGGASCSSCGGGGGSFCDLVDPNGNTIHQEFDVMGRVISVTDSLSHSSFTQYDKAGRKTLETDANGNATSYRYDESGRLLRVTEASGAVTEYTYDKAGNKLTQKDANGHVWSFAYDALNRISTETDPLNRVTTYTYDSLGNLQTKKDAKNQTATYNYNIRRLTSINYSDGTSETFTYDPLGRRTGMSNASVALTYGYDNLNRLTSVTNTTYNLSVAYAYDAAGNRTQLQAKTGTTLLSENDYTYDAKNRLVQLTHNKLGTFRFAYDPMDRRTSLQYPNGITTSYAYDKAYRLTAIASKTSQGQVVDAWSYQYDAVGNRLSKTDMNGLLEAYSYDNVYRLTSASYAEGTRESFTYDPVGNRLSQVTEAGQPLTYSYDVANQLLSAGNDTFTYDANGNTLTKKTASGTTTFTYDIKNRLTSIAGPEGSETSTFAPDNSRVRMVNASLTGDEKIIYDTAANPVLTFGSGSYEFDRVYGPGTDELLAEWKGDNTHRYYAHDALGSITSASDETGLVQYRRTYRPFGRMSSTAASSEGLNSRFGFTGREISIGSTMQYRARQYDSSYGRFLQQDEHQGSEKAPPSLHRYIYVLNSPCAYVDPSGHDTTRPFAPGSGAGAFAVFNAMVMMTATVYGVAEAVVYAMMDNSPWSSSEFNNLLGYVGTVIGVSSIFAYLQTAAITGALVGIGFSVASSFTTFWILTHPKEYTVCEKVSAWAVLILSTIVSTVFGFIAGFAYQGWGNTAGLAATLTYLSIATINFLGWGLNWAAGFALLSGTDKALAIREQSCRRWIG